jgi:transcriptional regulator with XRE-family HTH domain
LQILKGKTIWVGMDTPGSRLGLRLRALRDRRGLSQEALSEKLGFKDRQTLSAIETGERRLSAEELLRAVQALGVTVDALTDPFQLAGEGRFSWRQSGLSPARLESFVSVAGRWIAAFRARACRGCRRGHWPRQGRAARQRLRRRVADARPSPSSGAPFRVCRRRRQAETRIV